MSRRDALPREAKLELSEGLRAVDERDEGCLPHAGVVVALKRMGLELRMSDKEIEKSLRAFEVSRGFARGAALSPLFPPASLDRKASVERRGLSGNRVLLIALTGFLAKVNVDGRRIGLDG